MRGAEEGIRLIGHIERKRENRHLDCGPPCNPSVAAGQWGRCDTFSGIAGGKKCELTPAPPSLTHYPSVHPGCP